MEIENHLSSSYGEREQGPNKLLAEKIIHENYSAGVQELLHIALHHKQVTYRNDAIHTLGYLAEKKPKWLIPVFDELLSLLNAKNNRTVWATMIILTHLTKFSPNHLYQNLPTLLNTAKVGSVITKDCCVQILIDLYALEEYAEDTFPLLLEQVELAPDNQLGQYVGKMIPHLKKEHKNTLMEVFSHRSQLLENESHKKRAARLMNKLLKT